MPRKVPEWHGKTPDTSVPPRVRLRVWERSTGYCRCGYFLTADKPWHADHCIPLILGGENRESNLRIICWACHKEKTKTEVATKSKDYRIRAKHAGIKRKKSLLPGSKGSGIRRRMDGTTWKE